MAIFSTALGALALYGMYSGGKQAVKGVGQIAKGNTREGLGNVVSGVGGAALSAIPTMGGAKALKGIGGLAGKAGLTGVGKTLRTGAVGLHNMGKPLGIIERGPAKWTAQALGKVVPQGGTLAKWTGTAARPGGLSRFIGGTAGFVGAGMGIDALAGAIKGNSGMRPGFGFQPGAGARPIGFKTQSGQNVSGITPAMGVGNVYPQMLDQQQMMPPGIGYGY